MNKFLNWKILLIGIVFLAAFLRFDNLSSNPPSLTWDEAAWGYNAYTLGIDGKDEFGKFLPITFLESFGDFKPPMYAYLDIIPIKLLGLNEFATRFPSALFGTLTVLLTFFLTRRIFYSSKNKELIAILSALFLAISPWHIMLSRAAFEANVATFFIISGVWLFLESIKSHRWLLLFSSISFVLSMYTFNTARIVSPMLVILLLLIFRTSLLKVKLQFISAFILGFIIFLPLLPFLFTPQASLRFKEVNIFSNSEVIESANQQIENNNNAFWSKVLNNRRVLFAREYVIHYFDNLSPLFLFTRGDGNPKFSIQDVGQMYIWDIIFFVGGFFLIFRKKEGYWYILPLWLVLGIIPAAVARETPHALRIETTLPVFQIITAYGFVWLIDRINKYRKFIAYCLLFILFINFAYFYHNYVNHYSYFYSDQWQMGYKDSIKFVNKNTNKFKNVFITDALGRPYIYYLFYQKVNPEYFRKNAVIKRDAFGFVNIEKLGKLNFIKSSAFLNLNNKDSLYITDKYNLPKNAKVLEKFYLKNGEVSLIAYEL